MSSACNEIMNFSNSRRRRSKGKVTAVGFVKQPDNAEELEKLNHELPSDLIDISGEEVIYDESPEVPISVVDLFDYQLEMEYRLGESNVPDNTQTENESTSNFLDCSHSSFRVTNSSTSLRPIYKSSATHDDDSACDSSEDSYLSDHSDKPDSFLVNSSEKPNHKARVSIKDIVNIEKVFKKSLVIKCERLDIDKFCRTNHCVKFDSQSILLRSLSVRTETKENIENIDSDLKKLSVGDNFVHNADNVLQHTTKPTILISSAHSELSNSTSSKPLTCERYNNVAEIIPVTAINNDKENPTPDITTHKQQCHKIMLKPYRESGISDNKNVEIKKTINTNTVHKIMLSADMQKRTLQNGVVSYVYKKPDVQGSPGTIKLMGTNNVKTIRCLTVPSCVSSGTKSVNIYNPSNLINSSGHVVIPKAVDNSLFPQTSQYHVKENCSSFTFGSNKDVISKFIQRNIMPTSKPNFPIDKICEPLMKPVTLETSVAIPISNNSNFTVSKNSSLEANENDNETEKIHESTFTVADTNTLISSIDSSLSNKLNPLNIHNIESLASSPKEYNQSLDEDAEDNLCHKSSIDIKSEIESIMLKAKSNTYNSNISNDEIDVVSLDKREEKGISNSLGKMKNLHSYDNRYQQHKVKIAPETIVQNVTRGSDYSFGCARYNAELDLLFGPSTNDSMFSVSEEDEIISKQKNLIVENDSKEITKSPGSGKSPVLHSSSEMNPNVSLTPKKKSTKPIKIKIPSIRLEDEKASDTSNNSEMFKATVKDKVKDNKTVKQELQLLPSTTKEGKSISKNDTLILLEEEYVDSKKSNPVVEQSSLNADKVSNSEECSPEKQPNSATTKLSDENENFTEKICIKLLNEFCPGSNLRTLASENDTNPHKTRVSSKKIIREEHLNQSVENKFYSDREKITKTKRKKRIKVKEHKKDKKPDEVFKPNCSDSFDKSDDSSEKTVSFTPRENDSDSHDNTSVGSAHAFTELNKKKSKIDRKKIKKNIDSNSDYLDKNSFSDSNLKPAFDSRFSNTEHDQGNESTFQISGKETCNSKENNKDVDISNQNSTNLMDYSMITGDMATEIKLSISDNEEIGSNKLKHMAKGTTQEDNTTHIKSKNSSSIVENATKMSILESCTDINPDVSVNDDKFQNASANSEFDKEELSLSAVVDEDNLRPISEKTCQMAKENSQSKNLSTDEDEIKNIACNERLINEPSCDESLPDSKYGKNSNENDNDNCSNNECFSDRECSYKGDSDNSVDAHELSSMKSVDIEKESCDSEVERTATTAAKCLDMTSSLRNNDENSQTQNSSDSSNLSKNPEIKTNVTSYSPNENMTADTISKENPTEFSQKVKKMDGTPFCTLPKNDSQTVLSDRESNSKTNFASDSAVNSAVGMQQNNKCVDHGEKMVEDGSNCLEKKRKIENEVESIQMSANEISCPKDDQKLICDGNHSETSAAGQVKKSVIKVSSVENSSKRVNISLSSSDNEDDEFGKLVIVEDKAHLKATNEKNINKKKRLKRKGGKNKSKEVKISVNLKSSLNENSTLHIDASSEIDMPNVINSIESAKIDLADYSRKKRLTFISVSEKSMAEEINDINSSKQKSVKKIRISMVKDRDNADKGLSSDLRSWFVSERKSTENKKHSNSTQNSADEDNPVTKMPVPDETAKGANLNESLASIETPAQSKAADDLKLSETVINKAKKRLSATDNMPTPLPTPPVTALPVSSPAPTAITPSAKSGKKSKSYSQEDVLEPFKLGWMREIVYRATVDKVGKKMCDIYYFTPEGNKLRSMPEISKYLADHKDSTFTVKNFTFAKETIHRIPFEVVRSAAKKSVVSDSQLVTKTSSPNLIQPKPPVKRKAEFKPSEDIPVKRTSSRTPVRTPKAKKFYGDSSSEGEHNEAKPQTRTSLRKSSVTSLERPSRLRPAVTSTKSTIVDPGKHVHGPSPVPSETISALKVPMKAFSGVRAMDESSAPANKKAKVKYTYSKKEEARLPRPCTDRCLVPKSQKPSVQCVLCLCLFHQGCIPFLHKTATKYVCKPCMASSLEKCEVTLGYDHRTGKLADDTPMDIDSIPESVMTPEVTFKLWPEGGSSLRINVPSEMKTQAQLPPPPPLKKAPERCISNISVGQSVEHKQIITALPQLKRAPERNMKTNFSFGQSFEQKQVASVPVSLANLTSTTNSLRKPQISYLEKETAVSKSNSSTLSSSETLINKTALGKNINVVPNPVNSNSTTVRLNSAPRCVSSAPIPLIINKSGTGLMQPYRIIVSSQTGIPLTTILRPAMIGHSVIGSSNASMPRKFFILNSGNQQPIFAPLNSRVSSTNTRFAVPPSHLAAATTIQSTLPPVVVSQKRNTESVTEIQSKVLSSKPVNSKSEKTIPVKSTLVAQPHSSSSSESESDESSYVSSDSSEPEDGPDDKINDKDKDAKIVEKETRPGSSSSSFLGIEPEDIAEDSNEANSDNISDKKKSSCVPKEDNVSILGENNENEENQQSTDIGHNHNSDDSNISNEDHAYSRCGPSSPLELSPSKRTDSASQSLSDMNRLMSGYDCLNLILKKLKAVDLLRVNQVCRSWRFLASQQFLWEKVSFQGLYVRNWQRCTETLKRCGTKFVDLRGIQHIDPEDTWQEFVQYLNNMQHIEHIIFGQVPPSVIDTVSDCMPLLRSLECYCITDIDIRPDMWDTPCKLNFSNLRFLRKLQKLKIRSAGGLTIPHDALSVLHLLPDLQHLSLTSLKLPSDHFDFLSLLPQLVTLELGNCTFWKKENYEALGKLINLQQLRLENGGGLLDVGLAEALKQMKNLQELELMNYKIPGSLGAALQKLENLSILSLWPDASVQAPQVNYNTFQTLHKVNNLAYFCWGIISEDDSIPLLPILKEPLEGTENSSEDWVEEVSFEDLFERLCDVLPDVKVEMKCISQQLLNEYCSVQR